MLVAFLLAGLILFASTKVWTFRRSSATALAFGTTSWTSTPGADRSPPSMLRLLFAPNPADGRIFEIDHGTPTSFTDADLRNLRFLRHLRKLSIPGSPITDAGVALLARPGELEWLAFDSPGITDAAAAHIAQMSGLRHLALSNARISDDGVSVLSHLPNLECLCIGGTRITDRVASSIIAMKHLKYLNVDRTAMTLAGAKAVWAASPTLIIYPYYPERAPRRGVRGKN
ncbi:MAG TPA: hypothetical protein VHZ24_17080 [Pirellulales bacterium]|jgi:hypothetical protein|nr:hypothetical protein [Pirellulales bacterium]